jgi:hypothetical protein
MKAAALALALLLPGALLGAERPAYSDSFDPVSGFKPAQRNLTSIFLQIAGSLEYHGTPEPYLRHTAQELVRIERRYRSKSGSMPSSRPPVMTDEYVERLSKNWNLLAPKLGLDAYAKEVGRTMRNAIRGTRGTGTILIDILNEHQSRVLGRMAGKRVPASDYAALISTLKERLELGKSSVEEERYEMARRDAVSFALGIEAATNRVFTRTDQRLTPSDAERVKRVLKSIILDVGETAQAELEAGIGEWAISEKSTVSR